MMIYSNEEIMEVSLEDLNNDGEMLFHHQMNELNAEIEGFCRGCKDFCFNGQDICGENIKLSIEHDSPNDMSFVIISERDGYEMPQVDFIPIDIKTKFEVRRRNDNRINVVM